MKLRPEPLRTDIFELLTIKRDETDSMPDELIVNKLVRSIKRPFKRLLPQNQIKLTKNRFDD